MAKLHDVTITTKGMRGYFETLALIRSFRTVLETVAKDYETDKSASAHKAIAATITFLIANKTPGTCWHPWSKRRKLSKETWA